MQNILGELQPRTSEVGVKVLTGSGLTPIYAYITTDRHLSLQVM